MCSFGELVNGKWYHYCGGAIVSENVIVTAAHCFFKGGYIRTTQIRTGDQNFIDTSDDDLVRTYEVSSIIKHPEYRAGYAKNDLAIVYTKTPIEFNARTNQISLPHQTFLTYIWITILAMPNANGNTITVVTT